MKDEDLIMSKIYLLSEFRGKGIGQASMEFFEQRAKEKGVKVVSLTVNKKNNEAVDFYKKFKYEVVDDVLVDIGGGFVLDDYVMQKSI